MRSMTKVQLDTKLSYINKCLPLGSSMRYGYKSGTVALELYKFEKLVKVLETGSCTRCYISALEYQVLTLKITVTAMKMESAQA